MSGLRRALCGSVLGLGLGCGDADPPGSRDAATDVAVDAGRAPDAGAGFDGGAPDAGALRLPYAERVVRFEPGPGAGFGAEDLPEVVLGAPEGSERMGALDVLSLGVGGEIVLDFGEDRALVDGPGPDLVVFENAFWVSGDPTRPFAELGEVAVSEDGESWAVFACDPMGAGMGRYPGCAGWSPTRVYDAATLVPLDPEVTGGDAFDLAELGLTRARFVRVRDLADEGSAPSAGFDLDAVGAVHLGPR